MSGRLAPGTPLRENALAQEMKVSRGPIREALGELAREGLVILPRNHSAYVARLARTDLEEIYTLRMALAPLAVRLAAQNASDAELNELQTVIDIMARRGSKMTGQEAAELDLRFCEAIYRSAKHRLLYQVWGQMRPLLHMLLLSHAVAQRDFLTHTLESHRALLHALRTRDADLACALATEYVEVVYEEVKQNYGD
jgi:DNA-binding GntR family transcriptional regulator